MVQTNVERRRDIESREIRRTRRFWWARKTKCHVSGISCQRVGINVILLYKKARKTDWRCPMEISFQDIALGEKFVSRRTKRCFGGVKVAPTETSSRGTVQALDGPTYTGNAVMLTDHVENPVHDFGTLIIMKDDEIVEVQR